MGKKIILYFFTLVQQVSNENFARILVGITILFSAIAFFSAVIFLLALYSEINVKEVLTRIALVIEGIINIFMSIGSIFIYKITFFWFFIVALFLMSFGIFSKDYRKNKIILIWGTLLTFLLNFSFFIPPPDLFL